MDVINDVIDDVIDMVIDIINGCNQSIHPSTPPYCAETEKPALRRIQLVRDKESSLCLSSPARLSPPLNRDVRDGRRSAVAGVLLVDTVRSRVAAERWRGERAAGVDDRSFATRTI